LPEKRIEYYPDFNPRLIDAIWKGSTISMTFSPGRMAGPASLVIRVKDAPPFRCEIGVKEGRSKCDFTGKMPDALIKALESADIGR
jgi:hypothetical protein